MFAVPGFSNLGAGPVRQTFQSAEKKRSGATTSHVNASDGDVVVGTGATRRKPIGKKRKRDHTLEVTTNNLDALWKDVVEKKAKNGHEQEHERGDSNGNVTGSNSVALGKRQQTHKDGDRAQQKKHQKKKDRKGKNHNGGDAANGEVTPKTNGKPTTAADNTLTNKHSYSHAQEGETEKKGDAPPSRKNKKNNMKKSDAATRTDAVDPADGRTQQLPLKAPEPSSSELPVGLTPLQQKMRQKLSSARFRHLNQMLYTTPSEEALQRFKEQPEMFEEYHTGFRQQVGAWPENPVDVFIRRIQTRGKVRESGYRRGGKQSEMSSANAADLGNAIMPLPRGRDGHSTMIDLGCGDAAISRAIAAMKPRPRLRITSYDLHAPNKFVTVADIANLPLQGSSVDVAIFCLALMGTNWLKMIEEAARVVRIGGEVWIAEIKSRFAQMKSGFDATADSNKDGKKKGGKKNNKKNNNKAGGNEPDNSKPGDGFVEEQVDSEEYKMGDGEEKFVRALARRGLRLRSRDGSNKMFVLMEFERTPSKPPSQKFSQPNMHGRVSMNFVDPENAKEDETDILKPCVYKLR